MIIGIDPGKTTGLAWYYTLDTPKLQSRVLEYTSVMQWLRKMYEEPPYGVKLEQVVIERFQTSGRLSKYGLLTIDLVGQVKGYCFAKEIPCKVQSPQSRKAWEKIVENLPGNEKRIIHEEDALMHLLQYLETSEKENYEALLLSLRS